MWHREWNARGNKKREKWNLNGIEFLQTDDWRANVYTYILNAWMNVVTYYLLCMCDAVYLFAILIIHYVCTLVYIVNDLRCFVNIVKKMSERKGENESLKKI